jgi:hypothetical protein
MPAYKPCIVCGKNPRSYWSDFEAGWMLDHDCKRPETSKYLASNTLANVIKNWNRIQERDAAKAKSAGKRAQKGSQGDDHGSL